jgi:hypothetical protein
MRMKIMEERMSGETAYRPNGNGAGALYLIALIFVAVVLAVNYPGPWHAGAPAVQTAIRPPCVASNASGVFKDFDASKYGVDCIR